MLSSDFSRHSLINILGPAELRISFLFISKDSGFSQHLLLDFTVLKQSSAPTLSDPLEC